MPGAGLECHLPNLHSSWDYRHGPTCPAFTGWDEGLANIFLGWLQNSIFLSSNSGVAGTIGVSHHPQPIDFN
jgi:hypothetical protein